MKNIKVCGIVAEYNPFHNGHTYHIQKAREITGCDCILVVLSGNFVQRGEPAVYDKFVRTKAALKNGADAVIELPVYFAPQSAEFFANYAVRLLEASGCTDCICFGSENGDINSLGEAGKFLSKENADFRARIKSHSKSGKSFALSRAKAAADISPEFENILSSPNNILGIEYVKALESIKSNITPFTVKRLGAGYNDIEIAGKMSSASAIRNALKSERRENGALKITVPDSAFCLYAGENPVFPDMLSDFLHFRLRTTTNERLSEIFEIKEGIQNRILKAAQNFASFSEIAAAVKTKRYAMTAVWRMLLNIILDIKKRDFLELYNSDCQYIRVLGFNRKSPLVPLLFKFPSVPVITGAKEIKRLSPKGRVILEKEIESTNIYDYIRGERNMNREYTQPLAVL